MANFAIIFENQVTNVIVADSLVGAQEASPTNSLVVETKNGESIGWKYDGTQFIAPTEETK